jgi:hypothetical protein
MPMLMEKKSDEEAKRRVEFPLKVFESRHYPFFSNSFPISPPCP